MMMLHEVSLLIFLPIFSHICSVGLLIFKAYKIFSKLLASSIDIESFV